MKTKKSHKEFGMVQLLTLGTYRVRVRNPKNGNKNTPFVLVKSDSTQLISRKTAGDMGIITINYDVFKTVHVVENHSCANIRNEPFSDGLGQFRDNLKTVKLHVDDVPAKILPAKRVETFWNKDCPTATVNQMAVSVKCSGDAGDEIYSDQHGLICSY